MRSGKASRDITFAYAPCAPYALYERFTKAGKGAWGARRVRAALNGFDTVRLKERVGNARGRAGGTRLGLFVSTIVSRVAAWLFCLLNPQSKKTDSDGLTAAIPNRFRLDWRLSSF